MLTRRSILRLGAVASAIHVPAVFAQSTILPEVQVTKALIPDFEFDWGRNGSHCTTCNSGAGNSRFVWSEAGGSNVNKGKMWVGSVDPQTGAFYPPDGRGVLVDTNVAPPADFGNGPEWVAWNGQSQIVYTKYAPGAEWTPENAGIGLAKVVNGSWSAGFMAGGMGRASPAGSLDRGDPAPRIHYVSSVKGQLFWRDLTKPAVENVLAVQELTDGNARRWVPGTRKIIFQGKVPGSTAALKDQIFTFDTDSGHLEQLTFDDVGKLGVAMWRAPEFGNEYVFLTMPQGRKSIRIYRQIAAVNGTKRWTVIKTIGTPTALPFVWSPEVFTHNGRSYVFFQLSSSSKFWDRRVPTHIAMSGIDPLRNDFRMLTNDSTKPRVRLDPEYFITAQGPFIYYNRFVPETADRPAANDGVWRVDTRLGPPLR